MALDSRIRDHAQRLLVYEAAAEAPTGPEYAASRVIEKLRSALITLAGARGFHALLSRSLKIAMRQAPILDSVRVGADGSLDGFSEVRKRHSDKEIAESAVILITQLLGLLTTFVGEALTVRLIHTAWPDLPFNGSNPRETE